MPLTEQERKEYHAHLREQILANLDLLEALADSGCPNHPELVSASDLPAVEPTTEAEVYRRLRQRALEDVAKAETFSRMLGLPQLVWELDLPRERRHDAATRAILATSVEAAFNGSRDGEPQRPGQPKLERL